MSADTKRRDTWDATVGLLFFVEKTGCPPTRESDILETRPSMCCFYIEKTGCPPTRKSDILETRPRWIGFGKCEKSRFALLACLLLLKQGFWAFSRQENLRNYHWGWVASQAFEAEPERTEITILIKKKINLKNILIQKPYAGAYDFQKKNALFLDVDNTLRIELWKQSIRFKAEIVKESIRNLIIQIW